MKLNATAIIASMGFLLGTTAIALVINLRADISMSIQANNKFQEYCKFNSGFQRDGEQVTAVCSGQTWIFKDPLGIISNG